LHVHAPWRPKEEPELSRVERGRLLGSDLTEDVNDADEDEIGKELKVRLRPLFLFSEEFSIADKLSDYGSLDEASEELLV
jgi:hypothetical protein